MMKSLTSDNQKDEYAQTWYSENIDNEDTFLFVYFEEQNSDEIGYMAYVNGKQVTSVMDSEAIDIFWNYIDRYWTDSSLSTVDVFTKTFDSTAKTIMKKSTTSKDIIKNYLYYCRYCHCYRWNYLYFTYEIQT